ncbi:MAG: CvpA family protein [Rhodocyclaceae bacterium]|nr:CvpA family protein [Rhodocyclaceae bacterium]MCO5096141.1 CvpA family protein [Rhodocyclaceae bacterium]MCP5296650.1 CvpA family protein [Zoogloeaceae bacterium]MCW5594270.1 CvpA family protein [Rhodocyclaceae bacterium]
MTVFDYAVLAIVTASILLGVWRGLISEVLALAAWVAALLAGRALAPEMAPMFGEWLKEPALQYAAAFAVIALAVLVVIALLRIALSKLLRAIGLGPLDRFLGAVFGVARGGLVVLLCVLIGGLTVLPQQAWWRQAWMAPPLETAVLAAKPWLPDAVAKRIRYR